MTLLPFALAGLGCAIMSNPPRRRRRRPKARRTRRNPGPTAKEVRLIQLLQNELAVAEGRYQGRTYRDDARALRRAAVEARLRYRRFFRAAEAKTRSNPRRRNPMTPETFLAEARASGCKIEAGDSIITLTKHFEPGSKAGYTAAEGATSLVYSAPGKGGSVWGTDGGSIGGYVGLKGGYCTLNKSGVQKRWLKALQKLIAAEGRTNPRRRRRR